MGLDGWRWVAPMVLCSIGQVACVKRDLLHRRPCWGWWLGPTCQGTAWRIIPLSKWLISMVIVSLQDLGLWDPFQMAIHGLYMRVDNYLLTVMILQVLSAGVSLMNLTGANGREWQKSTCSHSALKKNCVNGSCFFKPIIPRELSSYGLIPSLPNTCWEGQF